MSMKLAPVYHYHAVWASGASGSQKSALMGKTQNPIHLKSCTHWTFNLSDCLCLQPGSVFDVIPGDMCSSIILASCAAPSQVCPGRPPSPCHIRQAVRTLCSAMVCLCSAGSPAAGSE